MQKSRVSSYQGLEARLNDFESLEARLKSSADPTRPTRHLVFVANLLKELSHSTLPWVGLEFWSENSMAGCASVFFDCNGYMALFRHWKANLFDIQQFEKPGWQLNFCASYLLNRLGKSCCTKLLKSETNVPLMDDNGTSVFSILSNVSNELWRVWSCCVDECHACFKNDEAKQISATDLQLGGILFGIHLSH